MSIASPPLGGVFQPPPFPVYQLTVDQYHRMIESGVLTDEDRVELLEGYIVPKMPHNPPHDVTIDKAQDALRRGLPVGWRLRIQSAITTSDSEPEPDFAIVPCPAERYLAHHPYPEDIATLIEVADTTLQRDRGDKGQLYARAGIAIYWIINLQDRQVEVYTDPTGPGPTPCYRQRQDFGVNDSVPLVIGGQVVAMVPVADLLP